MEESSAERGNERGNQIFQSSEHNVQSQVQVRIPKRGLGWQVTWFSRGATVSAKNFPGSSCHLVVTQDICLFLFYFFSPLITTIHGSSSTFPRLVMTKNFWEMFFLGKPWSEALYSQIAVGLTFSPRIRKDTLFSIVWKVVMFGKGKASREGACLTSLVILKISREFQAVFSNTLKFEFCCCISHAS